MSFVSYLKRQSESDDPFLGLESDMSEALEREFKAEAIPGDALANELKLPEMRDEAQETSTDRDGDMPATVRPSKDDRLTSNSKKFLSGLETFEIQFKESQADLKEIGEKIANLAVAQHLTRDFLNLMQASLHNSNEIELTNKDLSAKNRALSSQLESAKSLNSQLKTGLEEVQRRETRLQQEKEMLRSALASANDELAEVRKEASANDAELAEVRRELAAKSSLSEKLMRDNELIREKHVNLSVDLDAALKTASEMRRKHDELSTNLKGTSAELAETLSQLTDAQKEAARVSRELEIRSAKLTETGDALRAAEYERDEVANRLTSELQAVRNENQNVQTRFEAASREQANATEELIAIKLKLNDAISEKRVADEKLAAMAKEVEKERREHSSASTKLSEINLERASERVVIESAQQQLKEQQDEVARLKEEIKRLLPYERLYRVKKEEMQCAADIDADAETKADTDGEPAAAKKTGGDAESNPQASKAKTAASSKKTKAASKSSEAA